MTIPGKTYLTSSTLSFLVLLSHSSTSPSIARHCWASRKRGSPWDHIRRGEINEVPVFVESEVWPSKRFIHALFP